ncbi:MAG: hypothetical protein AAFU79_31415, partial [Myxococcota bacterium]
GVQAKVEAMQGERHSLQGTLDGSRREQAALQAKVEVLESARASLEAATQRQEGKLRDRLLEAEASAEAARADAAKSAARAAEAEHQASELQRELSSAEEEVERQSEAVLELYARIDELRADVTRAATPRLESRSRSVRSDPDDRLRQLEAMAEAAERGRVVAEQALAQRNREFEALLEQNRTRAAVTLEELESNSFEVPPGESAPFAALVDEMSRSNSSVQLGGSAALLSPAGTHEDEEKEDDQNDRDVTEIMNLRRRED